MGRYLKTIQWKADKEKAVNKAHFVRNNSTILGVRVSNLIAALSFVYIPTELRLVLWYS